MEIGVVSDTHNNIKNLKKIILLLNERNLSLVIHTGDITNAKTLALFSGLNCPLAGVYGNNDMNESSLSDVAEENKFNFRNPPLVIEKNNRSIAIFHEPELIKNFLEENKDIDIVLHGHTHRYRNEFKDKVLYFNPGESAGMLEGKNSIGIVNLNDLSTKRIFF